jgi:DNA repair protein RecN (Recombination protein N)
MAARCAELAAGLAERGGALRRRRLKGAAGLADRVREIAAGLGLPDLELWFESDPLPPREDGLEIAGEVCGFGRRGCETLRLVVRTNPGERPGNVADIASGGERSRIFLALAVVDQGGPERPLLLFDEIDAGIGLDHAAAVARLLGRLAAERQVLCITHLPTVAARGDAHLRVSKVSTGNRNAVDIKVLRGDERVRELARLLGQGERRDEADESRVAYARQLLADRAAG